ncbi:MAG: helix-turn-helix transcriptional regulator [Microcoleus sp. SU_5_6]|nr:helix-turn-helix transcriptional regulator [Microcoleus sp. SU_5_6]
MTLLRFRPASDISGTPAPDFEADEGSAAAVRPPEPTNQQTPEIGPDRLSRTEREILHRTLAGKRPATIAAEMFLSEHTVRNGLKRINRKLGTASTAELREKLTVGRAVGRAAGDGADRDLADPAQSRPPQRHLGLDPAVRHARSRALGLPDARRLRGDPARRLRRGCLLRPRARSRRLCRFGRPDRR